MVFLGFPVLFFYSFLLGKAPPSIGDSHGICSMGRSSPEAPRVFYACQSAQAANPQEKRHMFQ